MSDKVLRSTEFDDVYFSVHDGLAETGHVFIGGNRLPERFAELPEGGEFVIGETGFGTGLNFLAIWKMFEQMAPADHRLHFFSFEKYPLDKATIADALSQWDCVLGDYKARMLDVYPMRVPGVHRVHVSDRVTLTLVFDDVNDAITEMDASVDAWFLDGFTPSKNPGMWSDTVFENMARMSAQGATLATFTAAGFVRRGLDAAGFDIEKQRGFGHKRDMVVGCVREGQERVEIGSKKRIAVVGSGLAGASAAYFLKHAGHEVQVFEKSQEIAAGASGNVLGLVNPRFGALKDAGADFYTQGFALAGRCLSAIQEKSDIRFKRLGNLFLANDDKKKQRFAKVFKNWLWDAEHMKFCDSEQASNYAGVRVEHESLYLPDGAAVSPKRLCEAYLDGVKVHLGADISDAERDGDDWIVCDERFDVVILACGFAVREFAGLEELPLQKVRGQVSVIEATDKSAEIACNLSHKGYISAPFDRMHVIGATFQPWSDEEELMTEDDDYNLRELTEAIPSLGDEYKVVGGKVGFRCASKYRKPIIGAVPDQEGLYVSTAHGSHGLVSTIVGAQILSDMIGGRVQGYMRRVAEHVGV